MSTAITQWDGVTVAGTPKRVQDLRLRKKGMTGSIPDVLARLDALQRLDLSENALTGSIPEGLSALSHLTSIPMVATLHSPFLASLVWGLSCRPYGRHRGHMPRQGSVELGIGGCERDAHRGGLDATWMS